MQDTKERGSLGLPTLSCILLLVVWYGWKLGNFEKEEIVGVGKTWSEICVAWLIMVWQS